MSVGTILIGLAMLVITVPLVAKPILEKKRGGQPEMETAVAKSYQDILLALRDLELDHQTGIVTDDDYSQLQAQLMTEAAAALADEETSVTTTIDAQIETVVSAYRHKTKKQTGINCPECDNDLNENDKYCAYCGTAVLACPQCQNPHSPDDNFCTVCGHTLTSEVGALA